ncbi:MULTISPECIES: serine/threonine-protein kinase PknK [Sorangium]|uniref:non-specific serine/threonine protein kinase n=1 Tax=Sorangium cellulosum TaxID=56 RepID=A0A4P2QN76_SORCE|nr:MULTISPECIES: serine/threonine-protein kinase [Sorangium]AUX31318.1 ATPase AAA [Sorangium cellulosum]WCQ90701.1 serine-threonine kinase [Sorangium sp. Soce836]
MTPLRAFERSERFEIRRQLGAGGFGAVYEAVDRRYGCVIALKALYQQSEPSALLRFKQEFRSLADVVHPNLVTLHELLSDGGTWCFTMELVDGIDFLSFVRVQLPSHRARAEQETVVSDAFVDRASLEPSTARPFPTDDGTCAARAAAGGGVAGPDDVTQALLASPAPPARRLDGGWPERTSSPPRPLRQAFSLDTRRLRAAFAQLVEGVSALHAANILHRDLKPSNVLVTRDGRVVLLDFGIAKELKPRAPGEATVEDLVGTPAYMPPERLTSTPETEASDWYSVGVMLYEALTGALPFAGSVVDTISAKLWSTPMPPSLLVDGVPRDLDELCAALLQRDAAARPSSAEVVLRLHGERAAHPVRWLRAPPEGAERLVGRERELGALEDGFRESAAGRTLVVLVAGRSGMGKSALASSFLRALRERGAATVLAGRCHERESVPYKALDSLVDALCEHLRRMPPAESASVLPDDIHALARLFPALRAVPGAGADGAGADGAGADAAPAAAPDARQARWRAFQALKELFRRLAARRPLAICIDDLQWGDADSARLLAELLSPPDAPRLLLIACYRSDEAERCAPVGELRRLAARRGAAVELREVTVEPLSHEQAMRLALERLGPAAGARLERAQAIARESEGSPLSVSELIQYLSSRDGGTLAPSGGGGDISLRRVLMSRIDEMPERARRLIEVVAVAGCPIEQEVAFAAAELGEDALSCLTPLRAANLVRIAEARGGPRLEITHDRIREAVLAALDPAALAARHARLARAFEATGRADPQALMVHFHGAGELLEAARHAAAAADLASAALAFDRAAELYAQALAWGRGGPGDTPEARRDLLVRRATALANAGRCRDAAPLFLAAAEGAPPAVALDLRRRATEQYLVGGHLEEGTSALVPLLAEVGLGYPATTARAVLTVAALYARIRLRGQAFQERAAAEIPPEVLTRIDLCLSVSKALTDVDPLRSTVFLFRSLLLSLDAGEPSRVALGLSAFGLISAFQGTPSAIEEGSRLLARGEAIAERLGDGRLGSVIRIYVGGAHLVRGAWREALEYYDATRRQLEERCVGVEMERNLAQAGALVALEALGRFVELAERTASWRRSATAVGNLFASVSATIASAVPLLAADDAAEARRCVREVVARWARGAMHVQHLYALRLETLADLYEGEADAARARLLAEWRGIERSQQLRVQPARMDMLLLRARTAIAAAAARRSGREPLLREAEADAARLEREVRRDGAPLAALLRAGVARLRDRPSEALVQLGAAARGFDAVDMALHGACARRGRGELLGGDAGRALVAQADEAMARQGIRRPDRWTALYLPGFGGPGG